MGVETTLNRDGVEVSRYEYDDGVEIAADFGPAVDGAVDTVGETVIVLADGKQYDVETDGHSQAFMNNGVLTIEVDQ